MFGIVIRIFIAFFFLRAIFFWTVLLVILVSADHLNLWIFDFILSSTCIHPLIARTFDLFSFWGQQGNSKRFLFIFMIIIFVSIYWAIVGKCIVIGFKFWLFNRISNKVLVLLLLWNVIEKINLRVLVL